MKKQGVAVLWSHEGDGIARRIFYSEIDSKLEAAMVRNTSVTLGVHFTRLISDQVKIGSDGPACDVVGAGLRLQLQEEHEAKVKALQEALIAGEESGGPQLFDFEAFKARKRAEYEGR